MQRIQRLSILSDIPRSFYSANSSPIVLDARQPWRFLPPSERFNLTTRSFSSSPSLCKKKDKSRKLTGANTELSIPSEDPYDLSSLENGIVAAVARLKDDLSKLRMGGRFNTESLEDLRVSLGKGGKEIVRLGELAQVVPKGGRTVTILASEEEVELRSYPSGLFSRQLHAASRILRVILRVANDIFVPAREADHLSDPFFRFVFNATT